mmetsp:Transcript_802/g.1769  ORF Transcript_802/g.1769 Transcript_802/m.1769 type:complete len:326 (+) Transcript_802:422-1399(+)
MLLVFEWLRHCPQLAVQLHLHEKPMHVPLQHGGSQQPRRAQLLDLLHSQELEVVVHRLAGGFLQLLRQALQEAAPPRRRTQLRHEVSHHPALLARHHYQPTLAALVAHHNHIVDIRRGFDIRQNFVHLGVVALPNLHKFLVSGDDMPGGVVGDVDDGQAVLVLLHVHGSAGADVVEETAAVVCAQAQGQTVGVELDRRYVRHDTTGGHADRTGVHARNSLPRAGIPEVANAPLAAERQKLVVGTLVHLVASGEAELEGFPELPRLQVEPVHLVARCGHVKVAVVPVVEQVSSELGHAYAVVRAVGGVEVQCAVCLQKHQLSVVVG